MRRLAFALLVPFALWGSCASADYRITRDHGGLVDQYKVKYASIRDRGERVVIDGICNSACTLVLGIVPLNRICVTPRASLGFHMAYFDKSTTGGLKVMSYEGTADVLSYYPNGEGLAQSPRRPHPRHEEGAERARALGHHRSLPGRDFLICARKTSSAAPASLSRSHPWAWHKCRRAAGRFPRRSWG